MSQAGAYPSIMFQPGAYPNVGACPKEQPSALTYACVVCDSDSFCSARGLRRHLYRNHGLVSDSLREGSSIPYPGYVMLRANAPELHQHPRLHFPADWHIMRVPDVDPRHVSDPRPDSRI